MQPTCLLVATASEQHDISQLRARKPDLHEYGFHRSCPCYITRFLKLYESAFRMDGKKERIQRIDDANFGPVRKTLEWWPYLSATEVVASEGWWWKEVWKKGW